MTDTEKLVVATLTAAVITANGSAGSLTRVSTLYGEIARAMEDAGHFETSRDRNGDQGHGRR